jgi:hypothetical protein
VVSFNPPTGVAMPSLELAIGTEVALMPRLSAAPDEILAIARIAYAGPVFVQLDDGLLFATLGGTGLDNKHCIVAATDAHYTAIRERALCRQAAPVPAVKRRKHRGRTPGKQNAR